MSRAAGSIVRGNFKAAPDIRFNGPAAGGGYLLPVGQKVKVRGHFKSVASQRRRKGYQRLRAEAEPATVASCDGFGPLAVDTARGHASRITTKTLGSDHEYRQKTGN